MGIFRTEAFHQMFEFSIEMEKHGVNDHKNFTPKSPVKKAVENGTKTQATAAENGVKTGRVKNNFKNNRGGNVGNFRNENAPNNKGNSGAAVQVWANQNFGKKKKQN